MENYIHGDRLKKIIAKILIALRYALIIVFGFTNISTDFGHL